jgi:hypothetical protein
MSSMYEIAIPYHKKTVASRIAKGFDDFANRGVSPRVLMNHVKKLAGRQTIITSSKSEVVDPNTVGLNAYYDPDEDEEGEIPIEVVLVFNPDDKLVTMDRNQWREFAAELIDYLQHEMIHQYQYRSRGYQPTRAYVSKAKDAEQKKQQEYLGNPDEIEAYAHNLASELERKTKGNLDQQLRLLRNFSGTAITRDQAGRLLSPSLYGYFKDFNFDTNHPVLKSLMKKTYQYVMMKKKKTEKNTRVQHRNAEIADKERQFQERQEALDKDPRTTYTAIVDR